MHGSYIGTTIYARIYEVNNISRLFGLFLKIQRLKIISQDVVTGLSAFGRNGAPLGHVTRKSQSAGTANVSLDSLHLAGRAEAL